MPSEVKHGQWDAGESVQGCVQIISEKNCMRGHQDGSNIYVGNKGEKKEKEKIH